MTTDLKTMQQRRGVHSDWANVNPVLAAGELGVELDTLKWKVGDGTSRWTSLPYASGIQGPVGATGPKGDQGAQGPIGSITGIAVDSLVSGDPRAITDWGPPINAAIAAMQVGTPRSTSPRLIFGAYDYPYSTPINSRFGSDFNTEVVFQGAAGLEWYTPPTPATKQGSRLIYTGGASPVLTRADGAMASGAKVLNSAGANFPTDITLIGYPITIKGAGAAGADLVTQVASSTKTSITTVDAAQTTVNGATYTLSNFTAAINARGTSGVQFVDIKLLWNNPAFDGILVDMRFGFTWSANGFFERAQLSPDFDVNTSMPIAHTLVHINGMGETFRAIHTQFNGGYANVRGQYGANSDDAKFDHCEFAGAITANILNPGRFWVFDQPIVDGSNISSLYPEPPFMATDNAPANSIYSVITVRQPSFWDRYDNSAGPTDSVFKQAPGFTWHLLVEGPGNFWETGSTYSTPRPEFSLKGNGTFRIRDFDFMLRGVDARVPIIDLGDGSQALQQKDFVEIASNGFAFNLTGNTPSWPGPGTPDSNGLLPIVGADTGHGFVVIRGNSGFQDFVYRQGHDVVMDGYTAPARPTVAFAGSQGSGGVVLVNGTDEAGVIQIYGAPALVAGPLVDVTFGTPWKGGTIPYNSVRKPVVILTPSGNGPVYGPTVVPAGVPTGPGTVAAAGYAQCRTGDSDGHTGWTLCITNPVSTPGQVLTWDYRVVKI